MHGRLKGIPTAPHWRLCNLAQLSTIFLLLILLIGCNQSTSDQQHAHETKKFIKIGEIAVPVFSSAEEQLNYTRQWFEDIQEKRAALHAFLQLFPENKQLSGVASLDLAYLQLGSDYRFTPEHACFAAIKDYRAILSRYDGHPGLQAKALWYIGWIYTNLLAENDKGMAYFIELVEKFPHEQVSLLPPAPWVSIIYRADESINTALYHRSINHWAALALLEIVQHGKDGEVAWQAFDTLWQDYRKDKATGFALKIILQRRLHTDKALERARQYMEKEFSNVHILGDIQREINAIIEPRSGAAG